MPAPVLSFLRDCFEEDHRRTELWDVFGRSVSHHLFASGAEKLLTGELAMLPVDAEESEPLARAATLYRRERELLYGSLFIIGRRAEETTGAIARSATICAPLVLFPARFVDDAPYRFVVPERAALRLNEPLLEAMCGAEDAPDVAEALLRVVADGLANEIEFAAAVELLRQAVPALDHDAHAAFPRLASGDDVAAARTAAGRDRRLRLVAASATLLAPRGRASRGVVAELDLMAAGDRFSPPIRGLLTRQAPAGATRPVGRVPAILSAPQHRIVEAAARYPLSVAIGPPGTGKSFTIAALALEHIGRGESVVIASRMDHAVSVVERIITEQLGAAGLAIRGGDVQRRRQLAAYVKELLAGMHTVDAPGRRGILASEKALRAAERALAMREALVTRRAAAEIKWSRHVMRPANSLSALLGRWTAIRTRSGDLLWDLERDVEQAREAYVQRAREHLMLVRRRVLDSVLRHHRGQIQTFDRALRSRSSGKQTELFEDLDLDVLLQAFPLWMVTLGQVADLIPYQRELFDVAIIDEATQVDMASALPLLQRAKRAVIVGDPRQLRHVSFLSRDRQRGLAEKHGLSEEDAAAFDYRSASILDLADDRVPTQDGVSFLNEHFRSAPPIIQFSNERFYAGRIRVMTNRPWGGLPAPLSVTVCAGRRAEDGSNLDEAVAIVGRVRALIEQERGLPADARHSIGILSPFRSQVDLLAGLVADQIPPHDVVAHDILIGTAHTFQGEERDVIFLSFAIDADTHPASLSFAERPDVFNVAITRARVAQHVFVSRSPGSLPPGSLLRDYLSHCEATASGDARVLGDDAGAEDAFVREVSEALGAAGLSVRTSFPLAGLTLDLVAFSEGGVCGVDLLGYPGHFETALPRAHYQMLARAGLPLVPLSFARWRTDPDACIAAVREAVRRSRRPAGG